MALKLKKISINNYLLLIWSILLIVDCFTIYYKLIGYMGLQILNIIISSMILFFGNYRRRLVIKRVDIYFISYYLLICFLLFVFSDYNYLGFVSGCLIPIIIFYLIWGMNKTINKIEEFLYLFSQIIFVLCVISLLFYIFGSVLNLIEPTSVLSSLLIDWSDFDYKSYFGIYFEGHKTYFMGKTILRNIGIFVEAPVFTYVIINALYVEMFLKDNTNKIKIIMYVLTALSTYSTTSIALTVILVFIHIYLHYMKRSLLKLLVPIVFILSINIIYTVISDKLMIGNDSGSVRMDDLFACFKAFAAHPIFGIGYNALRALDPYRSAFRQTGLAGMSAGIPYVLANGGILYGSIYLLPPIVAIFKYIKNKMDLQYTGFILLQAVLTTVIITEYTLLAECMLTISWYMILNISRRNYVENSINNISCTL